MRVADFLSAGKENALPGRDLVRLLGLRDLRDLTQMVEVERRAGSPICASVGTPPGYYLAESAEELRFYLASLQRRENEVGKTRQSLETILHSWEARA